MNRKTVFPLFYLASLLLLTGCIANPAMMTATGSPKSSMQFIDVSSFDADMKSSMSAGLSNISVTPLAAVQVNNIPPRLGKWLNAVRESGGNIDVEPKTKSAVSILSMILSLLEAGTALFQVEENIYESAARYNVVILYEPNDGQVKSFEFIKR